MVNQVNPTLYEKIPRSFYLNENVVEVAKSLLGNVLFSSVNGVLTAGSIVETEAYCGRGDKACHAYAKRTSRTEVMYKCGGIAYVYLCYGIHHLVNVVTNVEGQADAVLIRAIEPILGVEDMKMRREYPKTKLSSGPGTLAQAMGIDMKLNGADLLGDKLWIAESKESTPFEIQCDKRIGVAYAEEDALRPWRFVIKGNKFVSKEVKE